MSTDKKEERKKRSKNWNAKDSCLLVELYEKYHKVIVGKFEGRKVTVERKEEAWQMLLDELNSSPIDYRRDMNEIKKRISNIKDKVREYATALRRYKTSGGPKPDDPDAFISKMYDIIYGESGESLAGIGSGVESDAGTAAAMAAEANIGEEEMDEAAEAVSTIVNADANDIATDNLDTEAALIAYNQRRTTSTSLGTKPPMLPLKKRNVVVSGGPVAVPLLVAAPQRPPLAATTKTAAKAPAAEIARLQHELLEEQLAMVRENRQLIAEQRALITEKTKYVRLKSALVQQKMDTSAMVITSLGTPTSHPATLNPQQEQQGDYSFGDLRGF